MKRNVSLLKYVLLIALCCVACVNEKDLYEPSGEDPGETEELLERSEMYREIYYSQQIVI